MQACIDQLCTVPSQSILLKYDVSCYERRMISTPSFGTCSWKSSTNFVNDFHSCPTNTTRTAAKLGRSACFAQDKSTCTYAAVAAKLPILLASMGSVKAREHSPREDCNKPKSYTLPSHEMQGNYRENWQDRSESHAQRCNRPSKVIVIILEEVCISIGGILHSLAEYSMIQGVDICNDIYHQGRFIECGPLRKETSWTRPSAT